MLLQLPSCRKRAVHEDEGPDRVCVGRALYLSEEASAL